MLDLKWTFCLFYLILSLCYLSKLQTCLFNAIDKNDLVNILKVYYQMFYIKNHVKIDLHVTWKGRKFKIYTKLHYNLF